MLQKIRMKNGVSKVYTDRPDYADFDSPAKFEASYTNKDGQKVYTTDVVVEEHDFCESKGTAAGTTEEAASPYGPVDENGFMNVPDGISEELPFN